MINKCKVKLKNEYVMVIEFNGKDIQMPSCDCVTDFAYVQLKDGRYSVVDEKTYEESKVKKPVQKEKRWQDNNNNKNKFVIDNEEKDGV